MDDLALYGSEKKLQKARISVDVHQLCPYAMVMIMERIRKEIETSGKSRYRISAETGIDKAALCRIMQGGSCKAESADILLKYFGLTIAKKGKKGPR